MCSRATRFTNCRSAPVRRYFNSGGISGKLLGGWQISTIAQIRTGRPISFLAWLRALQAQTPTAALSIAAARSDNNTANTTLTLSELQSMTGLFRDPTTGLPLLVDPQSDRT